ncbi:MAG: hypothetical protein WC867_06000 [Candidatus Pacearchaeota archaeon]|jgi:HEPN domain-containing protein
MINKFKDKLFWIVPILALIIISLFSFYLNPQIGISVLITSIGIIFTTIWLYILLPQRENRKWKFVEKEVRNELSSTIRNLFDVSIGYFEGGTISIIYEVKQGVNEEAIWENARLEKLKEFSKKDNLALSDIGKLILKKGNPATFVRYKQDLGEIERKYFKFMKPEEIISLITIQKLLTYLINITNSTQVKIFKSPEKYYEENLCKYALELYKEIFHFHTNFIKLYPKN